MLFTFTDGENDSDLLQFCPKAKSLCSRLLEGGNSKRFGFSLKEADYGRHGTFWRKGR